MSTPERRHPQVVNVTEVEPRSISKGTRFGFTSKWLSRNAGGAGVACSWYEVPPGRTAFPKHYHCANDEAMFVLEGEGTLRIGDKEVPVKPGDYVAFPAGPEHAHQLVNSGSGPLRYLALSTMINADVVGYPDSGKVAAMAISRSTPGAFPYLRKIFMESAEVDYYDGEKVD